jgi:DNA-binding IclR family transcriptional regulator
MSNAKEPAITPERIQHIGWGYTGTLILEAAVRCRVFDALDGGPGTLDEVAAATGASRRGLRALLNALVGLELLARRGDAYALTPESAAFLVSTKPGFRGGLARHASARLISLHTRIPTAL